MPPGSSLTTPEGPKPDLVSHSARLALVSVRSEAKEPETVTCPCPTVAVLGPLGVHRRPM